MCVCVCIDYSYCKLTIPCRYVLCDLASSPISIANCEGRGGEEEEERGWGG